MNKEIECQKKKRNIATQARNRIKVFNEHFR